MPALRHIAGNLVLFVLVSVCQAESNCTSRPANRIVGGVHAKTGEFPFMVSFYIEKPGHIYLCGGTILDSRHILTAAHCLFDRKGNKVRGHFYIDVGCHDRSICRGRYDIGTVVVHEKYDDLHSSDVLPFDIAVLETEDQIQFGPDVGPVQLVSSPSDEDRQNFLVIGWGSLEDNTTSSDPILRKVAIPIVPFETCKQFYFDVNRNMICAGEQGKDSCQGDSGGPLLAVAGHSYVQVGIVSNGGPCGNPFGGVYTRVASYRRWIQKAIWRLNRGGRG